MPDGARLRLRLEDHWFHNHRVILKFEGYDTMTAAKGLVGGRLVIGEADVEPLAEGQYLEREVVGSEVVTRDGQKVGVVTKVMRTGGTDLLVLEGIDGRERLIPFADEICTDVDLAARRITIDPPDGLLDL
jgi:16S rRNA processing protein RimM